MLFSHICWMEKYKKIIWTELCKLCFVSDLNFIMRRSKKEEFSPTGQHKIAGKNLLNIRCKFWWNFGSLPSPCPPYPPWSMWWTCWMIVFQSLAISCWQTNFPQGKIFAFFPILMMKVKYEIKQICTILYLYVWEFVNSFYPPNVKK